MAIRYGHLNIASELISAGADLNVTSTQYGSTPLHLACWYSHYAIASRLITAGADLTICDKYDSKTAIAYVQDGKMKSLLLERIKDVNVDLTKVDVDIYAP